MKSILWMVLIAFGFSGFGCSDVSPDAVDLEVDFSWEGMPGRYKITVKAIDDSEIIIGIGSKKDLFLKNSSVVPQK